MENKANQTMDFKCFVCSELFFEQKKIIAHLKKKHFVKENKDPIYCVRNNSCTRYFYDFRSLNAHLKTCIISLENSAPEEEISEECCQMLESEANTSDGAELSYFMHQFDLGDGNYSTSFDHEKSTFNYDCPEKSKTSVAVQKAKDAVNLFHASVYSLNLNESETNGVYASVKKLVEQCSELYVASIEENDSASLQHVMDQVKSLICNQLDEKKTTYKRNKQFESNDRYVAPKDLAIGLRWERKKVKRNGKVCSIPRLIQCTFQFVSIVETLKALFMSHEFEDYYFKYNSTPIHECDNTKLYDFCCGSTFRGSCHRIDPYCLKLQIYADEFEVCNPLQSKAGVHKICAVYFTIRNLPKEFSSKTNNIFLVCLINSNDLKTKTTDFNNIWRPIVNDLKYMEYHGVKTSNHGVVKAILTHLSFDNLGANVGLGFASSFSASYYCRFCLRSKTECQSATVDDISKWRTEKDYDEHMEIVENSEKVSYAETKGLKCFCVLNELTNFHVTTNPTADIFHDHNEGSIPHLLALFFEHCFSIKIFSIDELKGMFNQYEYGWLNRKNLPSQIKLESRSIGQNGTQCLCLFRSLPFVLYRFKDEPRLESYWKGIQLLLKILVIIYSYEIRMESLQRLDTLVTLFLECMITVFKQPLIPKLHFLLHYSIIMQMVGPIVYMSTIRYEAKHQIFKNMVKKTRNFQNINKSLATKNQKQLCVKGAICQNEITCSKQRPVTQEYFEQYKDLLLNAEISSGVMETKCVRCNSFEYKIGFLFVYNSVLYRIQNIVSFKNQYYFLSKKYEVLSFVDFLNSFQIEEKSDCEPIIINFASLSNQVPYETKLLHGKEYIIEENLEFRYQLWH